MVQRRQRHSSFRSCQFSYPLSFRGQVCETQGPLPCFPSTVLSSWHPSSLIGSRRVRFPDVSGRIEVLRLPVTHPRSLICFASGVHAALLGSCLAACAPKRSEGAFWAGVNVTGDPIAGLLSRGRVRDLPGSQAIHPVPLPRSRTPAESTIPRLLTVSSMLPPLVRQRRLQRINHIGAIAGLQHLLPTLQEWCCHHPCKAYFRLAGSPLPGGS